MAAQQDSTVFADEDIDDEEESQYGDEDDDDELENDDVLGPPEDDEEDLNSGSPTSFSRPDRASIVTVPIAVAAVSNREPLRIVESIGVDSGFPDKRIGGLTLPQEEKKPFDDSRRLFQRLWTDEDEIELLQGFLEYTTQRGSLHHHDTALFYDQIKSKLQLDFNKNQLVEKLRRLKKKYRNVVAKISSGKEFLFKTPHDQATFEISRKIWSDTTRIGLEDNPIDDNESNRKPNINTNFNLNRIEVKNEENVGSFMEKKTPKSRKRSRPQSGMGLVEKQVLVNGSELNTNRNVGMTNMTAMIEETVRSRLSPLFKELMNNAIQLSSKGFGGLNLNVVPLSLGGSGSMNFGSGEILDEKWRKQQILELEVYSKRLELVQDHIKTTLDELKSAGGS